MLFYTHDMQRGYSPPPPPQQLAPHPKISLAPYPRIKHITPGKPHTFLIIPCPLQYVLIDRRVEISIPTDHIQEDIHIQTK